MNKIVKILLILSIVLSTIFFMGGDPMSLRGFYYIVWISLFSLYVKKTEKIQPIVEKIKINKTLKFIALGVLMILAEETLAGFFVNILSVTSGGQLFKLISQYYANNLLLLSGFIVAWSILLKKFEYQNKEVFLLVGLFGIYAEKIYIHLITIPIMGIVLILPTIFTYMAIIGFPLLFTEGYQTPDPGRKKLSKAKKYLLGFIFPIIVSLPFLFVHHKLVQAKIIDVTVLSR